MIDLWITACLGLGGVLALRWVVATRGELATADRELRSVTSAVHGDVVDITGTVTDGPVLATPLRGLPCAFWHVRAITISSTRRTDMTRVEAERTSSDVFAVESDGVTLHVTGSLCRMGTGLVKVHGDQGSFARDLWVEGERIGLRPIAYGVRHVQEGALRPGDVVHLRGQLDTTVSPWRLVAVDGDQGVQVDTLPREVRRRRLVGIMAVNALLGVVFLGIAVVRIL